MYVASVSKCKPGKGYIIVGLQAASFSYGETAIMTSFVYDSTGARVKKSVAGGSTTVYLGKDYDITGSLTTKYIFLGDRRISTKKSDGTLEFIHDDHISSSNVVTDENGDQVAMLEYDPYGATVTHTGASDPKHKYTGQEEDGSTNLYYYGARYYDVQLGRFISADPTIQHPTDPQDFNRYAYARNNPIKYNDPTGFGWFSKLIGAIVGIVAGALTGYYTGNSAAGWAVGVALYRAVDTAISGGNFREIINAAANGAAEGYKISQGQKSAMSLFKDPKTDGLSKDTKDYLGGVLRKFGMDEDAANVLANQIESAIGKGRSYGEISNGKQASEQVSRIDEYVKSGISITFALFSADFEFTSTTKSALGLLRGGPGGLGINGGKFQSIDFTPSALYGVSFYAYLATEESSDSVQRGYYAPFYKAFSVSATVVRDKNENERIRNVRADIGVGIGSPGGVTFPVARRNKEGRWERAVFK